MSDSSPTLDFLSDLYADNTGRVSVWWRSTPGARSPYSSKQWFSWPEDAPKMAMFIDRSVSDHDVCVTTTLYSEDKRTPEFATTTNSIWMDSDTCEGSNYRVAPSWTVKTSPGRWQHHWTLDRAVSSEEASELVHRISIAHANQGADQSSWPANKIMRVPGTLNTSHGYPTTVRGSTTGEIHHFEDLQAAYKDVELPERMLVRDIPQLDVEELPPYGNVLAKLPPSLLDMATDEVYEGQDRSQFRYKLLLELFRAGLAYEEVLSVAWHSPSAKKWSEEDDRGLEGLQMEAVKAKVEALAVNADPVDPYNADTADVVALALDRTVDILTEEEREIVEGQRNFVDEYNAYARRRLPHDNDSYDRMNAWIILALTLSDAGYIPSSEGVPRPLNLFGMIFGETTTGKSSSFRLMRNVLDEFYFDDPNYDIGGNASESALLKGLHARDGETSFFNKDEAHGVLKVWANQDWSTGVRETIAELYDGSVPPILRSNKDDTHSKRSTTKFSVHLMGTNRAMFEGLSQDMFHSGFLPRFIWAIGKPRKITYDSFLYVESDDKEVNWDFDSEARKIAKGLRDVRDSLRQAHGGPASVRLSQEANERLRDAAYKLIQEFEGTRMWEMLLPSIQRWRDNVHKAAALLALHEKSTTISLLHVLKALESGEEWFTNLLRVMSQVSSSDFERSCDDIERYINSSGGRVTEKALYSKFRAIRGPFMKEFLESLHRQGRVWMEQMGKKDVKNYYVTPVYERDGR